MPDEKSALPSQADKEQESKASPSTRRLPFLGTNNKRLQSNMLMQLSLGIGTVPNASKDKSEHFELLQALINSFAPRDAVEGMITVQIVTTHQAAMECMRRAQLPDQPLAAREMNLRHAEKLSALFARQLDVLNKRQGKGHQKVTVEHVHVNNGGQAIVGNVQTTKSERGNPSAVPRAPGVPIDLDASSDNEQSIPRNRNKTGRGG